MISGNILITHIEEACSLNSKAACQIGPHIVTISVTVSDQSDCTVFN